MTKYICDLCKQELPPREVAIKFRFGSKNHDLCGSCFTRLSELLEGTGDEIIDMYFPNSGIVTVPNLGGGLGGQFGFPSMGITTTTTGNIQNAVATNASSMSPMTSLDPDRLLAAFNTLAYPTTTFIRPDPV